MAFDIFVMLLHFYCLFKVSSTFVLSLMLFVILLLLSKDNSPISMNWWHDITFFGLTVLVSLCSLRVMCYLTQKS